jgi:hypothetical protein
MGYSWIEVNISNPILSDIINEIHDNLDLLYDDLEINRRDWESDEEVEDSHMSTIKTAIEHADDMNYCRTHYTDHKTNDLDGYYVSHDESYNLTEDTDHDVTYDSLYKVDAYDDHYNNRLYDHYTGHRDNVNLTHRATNYIGYDINDNVTHLNSEKTTVKKSKNLSKNFKDNSNERSSHFTEHKNSKNNPWNSTLNTTLFDGRMENDYQLYYTNVGCSSHNHRRGY